MVIRSSSTAIPSVRPWPISARAITSTSITSRRRSGDSDEHPQDIPRLSPRERPRRHTQSCRNPAAWKRVVWGKRVSVRVDLGGARNYRKKEYKHASIHTEKKKQ